MYITVNGEQKSIPDNSFTIEALLKLCDVKQPDQVTVQLNGAFIDKKSYSSVFLKDNDEIDFLYFMGGGQ
jgi:sulfur carrier protein